MDPALPAREPVRDPDKIMLVLCYLGLLALIPLVSVKDSDYVQWHAKNGLVLGVGSALLLAVLGVLNIWLLWCPAVIALLVIDIMAMVKALNGERWRIPAVSDFAEKL
jgi:uncharacterized membrane protein